MKIRTCQESCEYKPQYVDIFLNCMGPDERGLTLHYDKAVSRADIL